MRNPLPIVILILFLLAGFLYWRHLQSPEVREASLRTALENHDAAAAERILNH
jgi:hypothetical protein